MLFKENEKATVKKKSFYNGHTWFLWWLFEKKLMQTSAQSEFWSAHFHFILNGLTFLFLKISADFKESNLFFSKNDMRFSAKLLLEYSEFIPTANKTKLPKSSRSNQSSSQQRRLNCTLELRWGVPRAKLQFSKIMISLSLWPAWFLKLRKQMQKLR